MSNMQYCRWGNTAGDMADCVEAMRSFNETDEDTAAENAARAEDDPDFVAENDNTTKFEALSDSERNGYYECLRLAAEMLENADPEMLRDADVNLKRLAA